VKFKRMYELGPRLSTVAELIPYGSRIADIGTDHAYLPIWLAVYDRIQSAIAADINPLPLKNAEENIIKYEMTDRIKLCLCDGLRGIPMNEVDTVVIAGMGGETIADILSAVEPCSIKFILQPMTNAVRLRSWLYRNGFRINRELLAREGSRIYPVMEVFCGSDENDLSDPIYERASRALIESESEYKNDYLAKIIRSVEKEAKSGINTEELLRMAEQLRNLVK